MNSSALRLIGLPALLFAAVCGRVVAAEKDARFSAEQIEFFESHIRPVLVAHCFECHSTDAAELKAGLYVDSRETMLKGGESGPAIVEGNPDASLLIASIKYESNEMPPDRKLPQRDIDALIKWVEMGSPWPEVTSSPGMVQPEMEIDWAEARASHWAWQPMTRPDIPQPAAQIGNNPIDHFVAARRESMGLQAAPTAKPRVLVRRIYLDLIGVPPTPEQVRTFTIAAGKNRTTAIESLVDQLLASPMYGQRWARHWLDVARYSDGHGGFLDNQALANAWRYRDWVVGALCDDMPIDQFIRLQIAGDLTGEDSDGIATGFFALGPTYRSDGGDPDSVAQAKGETLDDRIDTLTRGLLGITGSCARCHDHKFDPIPQQDYYSLAGIFNNTATQLLPLAPADIVKRFDEHQKAISDLTKSNNQLKKKIKNEKREPTDEEQAQLDQAQTQLKSLQENAPPAYDAAHALHETGDSDMHVALRGNLRKTGDIAPRRFLRIIAGKDPTRFTHGSGRQELAEAIIDPSNPLTARVFVNRVWLHHFGAGLVRTPSNFGTLGEQPTHPLLLDWLASDFVAQGWSLKQLHRQIMTTAAYQASSRFDADSFQIDGDNRFLWRMRPRRMDVEAWRDSLLSVTEDLDPTLGGPPIDNLTANSRRTLYAKVSRNGDVFASDKFLRRFDFPLMRATVAQRPQSIVPQQFLFLMNSQFMVERAKSLVSQLHLAADSDEKRIGQAYKLLYGRNPSKLERQVGLEFVRTAESSERGGLSSWERYAQVLLSSNEFMFVR